MARSFTPENVLVFVNLMTVVILSIAFHEFAHAWLADRFGDPTPRMAGRISFNPFVHIHPIWTVLLPAVLFWTNTGFMAAASTPVNPARMRKPRLHGLLTALGGPAANLLLACVGFAVLSVFLLAVGGAGKGGRIGNVRVADLLYMATSRNLMLAVFNFLPLPPLDGGEMIGSALPAGLRGYWGVVRRNASMIFIILAVTGLLWRIVGPIMVGAEAVLDFGVGIVNGIAHGG